MGIGASLISHTLSTHRAAAETASFNAAQIAACTDGVLIILDSNGCVLSWNAVTEEITHISSSDAKGHPLGSFFTRCFRDTSHSFLSSSSPFPTNARGYLAKTPTLPKSPLSHFLRLKDTLAASLASRRAIVNMPVQLNVQSVPESATSSGATHFLLRVTPRVHQDGTVDGLICVGTDVTQEFHSNQASTAARHFAEHVIDTLPIPVAILDVDSLVLNCANVAFDSFFDPQPSPRSSPRSFSSPLFSSPLFPTTSSSSTTTFDSSTTSATTTTSTTTFDSSTTSSLSSSIASSLPSLPTTTPSTTRSAWRKSQHRRPKPLTTRPVTLNGDVMLLHHFKDIRLDQCFHHLQSNPESPIPGTTTSSSSSSSDQISLAELQTFLRSSTSSSTLDWCYRGYTFSVNKWQVSGHILSAAGTTRHSIQTQKLTLVAFQDRTSEARALSARLRSKKAEGAAEATQAFMARLSHELRNPLNGILGNVQLLARTSLSHEQDDCLNALESSSHLLLNIIQDILDFSKLRSGSLSECSDVPFDLRDVVEGALDMHKGNAFERGLRLFSSVPISLTTQLVGDPTKISQILNNLLSNAIKFTDHGQVTVQVEVLAQDTNAQLETNNLSYHDDGDLPVDPRRIELRFEVRDSGIGISPQNQRKLFTPYFQVDQFGASGTGLGLSITRSLVQILGGDDVHLVSEEGVGTSVSFQIPLSMGDAKSKVATLLDSHQSLLSSSQICVLDQNFALGPLIQFSLAELGMTTSLETTVDGAVRVLEHWTSSARDECDDGVVGVLVGSESVVDLVAALTEPEIAERVGALGTDIHIILCSESGAVPDELGVTPMFGGTEGVDTGVHVVPRPIRLGGLIHAFLRASHHPLFHIAGGSSGSVGGDMGSGGSSGMLRQLSILAVDDSKINQKLVTRMLEREGHVVTAVGNGMDAVLLWMDDPERFDVVLMDISMPIMSGFEATSVIRWLERGGDHESIDLSSWPSIHQRIEIMTGQEAWRGRHVPIVAMTGCVLEDDHVLCLESGMDGFVGKPLIIEDLMTAIDQLTDPGSFVQ